MSTSKIFRKTVFLKKLSPYLVYKKPAKKSWHKDEQWKSIAIVMVLDNRAAIPQELLKELLRYLYKVRSKWEWNFKKQFGTYPADESMWDGKTLIVRDGIPVNLLSPSGK